MSLHTTPTKELAKQINAKLYLITNPEMHELVKQLIGKFL